LVSGFAIRERILVLLTCNHRIAAKRVIPRQSGPAVTTPKVSETEALRNVGYPQWAVFGILDVSVVAEDFPLGRVRIVLNRAELTLSIPFPWLLTSWARGGPEDHPGIQTKLVGPGGRF
jgi:hypothetical protein